MGNSILTVRAIVTIASHFIDFKTSNLFSVTCERGLENSAVDALSRILEEVDWSKINLSQIKWEKIDKKILQSTSKINASKNTEKRHKKGKEKNNNPTSNKGKKKQKGPRGQQKAFESIIQTIIEKIRDYNLDESNTDHINSDIWARLCKDKIQNTDLLNIGSVEERVAYRIFVKQLCYVFSSLSKSRKGKEKDNVLDNLSITQIQGLTLSFLGQLQLNHKINEVAAIHDYLYLGCRACQESQEFGSKQFAMLLSPSLLFGMDIMNIHEVTRDPYLSFGNFIDALLRHPVFANPYHQNLYRDFFQCKDSYRKERRELWRDDLPDSLIKSLVHFAPKRDPYEKNKKYQADDAGPSTPVEKRKIPNFFSRFSRPRANGKKMHHTRIYGNRTSISIERRENEISHLSAQHSKKKSRRIHGNRTSFRAPRRWVNPYEPKQESQSRKLYTKEASESFYDSSEHSMIANELGEPNPDRIKSSLSQKAFLEKLNTLMDGEEKTPEDKANEVAEVPKIDSLTRLHEILEGSAEDDIALQLSRCEISDPRLPDNSAPSSNRDESSNSYRKLGRNISGSPFIINDSDRKSNSNIIRQKGSGLG